MADGVLLRFRQLGGRLPRRQEEDRVVPEPAFTTRSVRDAAVDHAAEDLHRRLAHARLCECERTHHSCTPIGVISDGRHELLGLASGAGPPARAADTRSPVERRHLDPGVIGKRQKARHAAVGIGLGGGILGIRVVRLLDDDGNSDLVRRDQRRRERSEQPAELALLAAVQRRDEERGVTRREERRWPRAGG